MGSRIKYSVEAFLLFVCVKQVTAGYKMYWANKTLPTVTKDRCGKVTGTDTGWDKHPATYACEDDIGSDNCKPFIEGGAGGKAIFVDPVAAKRSLLCDDPYFQEAANKCRKTCGTCCEHEKYDCENTAKSFDCKTISGNPLADPSNSGQLILGPNLCGVKAFYEILLDACAHSCGFCLLRKTKGSKRKHHTSSATKSKKPQINPSKLKIPKKKGCKDTPPKKNKDGYCERRLYKCEEGKNSNEVRNYCKQTCAVCIPPDFQCVDKDKAKCEHWKKKDFCLNGDYPLSAKLYHCAATCDMCSG